ncbi:MAG: DUF4857 domain-containing protein [Campylobacterales bacterium]|nr:DUF4857 domain-containing protein [Campylobacterales bacterium]
MYKDIFSTRIDREWVYYSPVEKDFIKKTALGGKERKIIYSNLDGTKEYTLDQFKSKFPFRYYYDLLKTDNFPKEFISYSFDLNAIKREKSFLKIKPSFINTKVVNLYPLFESNPKYSGLSLPEDLFRLDKDGITFITTKTNSVDKKKSEAYNKLFLEKGAVFPLKEAYGTPSTQKPFDIGYFISDNKNQLFHLIQVDGKPLLNRVDLNGIDFKFALIKEDVRKEYYGVIIDQKSQLYLMMDDDYELVKLPIDTYDYKTKEFKISTTPINRIINITSFDEARDTKVVDTYITNLDYELLKKKTFQFLYKGSTIYETIKELVLPFRTVVFLGNSGHYQIEVRDVHIKALYLNILLGFALILFVKLTKRDINTHLIPFGLLVVGGIYSLITLVLFNKLISTKIIQGK